MRLYLKSALFFSVLLSVSAFASSSFTGVWSGEKDDTENQPLSTLSLDIKQAQQNISGSYCYISRRGARIDCPEEADSNLSGIVQGDSALVEFNSSFGGKGGKAQLTINQGVMSWQLLKQPEGGDYTAPDSYILHKDKEISGTNGVSKTLLTDKFTVTIRNSCGDFLQVCDKVYYLGVRNKDNSVLTLTGKTVSDIDTKKVIGAAFKNGNVEYRVDFNSARLLVKQEDKILVEQYGKWQKE
ncbi:hypothetical protein [Pantoea sp. FN0305]|uniref:hypothetical protein n=1 Tax=Pantoea sp. FN0305 TaxID=3418559 RepID=UPI003CF1F85E